MDLEAGRAVTGEVIDVELELPHALPRELLPERRVRVAPLGEAEAGIDVVAVVRPLRLNMVQTQDLVARIVERRALLAARGGEQGHEQRDASHGRGQPTPPCATSPSPRA